MVIAFISKYNISENLGGGILKATWSKAKGLSKLGVKVIFFQLGDKNNEEFLENGIYLVTLKSWAYARGKDGKATLDRLMYRSSKKFLFSQLDKFKPEAIISTAEYNIGIKSLEYAKLNKIKYFYYPHIIISRIEEFVPKENLIGRITSQFFLKPFTLNLINKSDGVVAINQASKDDLIKLGVTAPIILVNNSIDTKFFSNCDKSKIKQNRLLYAGLISERKNQQYLIEVLKYLPKETELHLAGKVFDQVYYKKLLKFIKDNNLNVRFLGEIAKEQLLRELEEARVFVSASKLEVQSLVILEALASGTQVVMLENETVKHIESVDGLKILDQNVSPAEFAGVVNNILEISPVEIFERSKKLKIYAQRFSEEATSKDLLEKLG